MQDVYQYCPTFENEAFLLRFIEKGDCPDLLKVYSDKKAVPFFNSDNCHGDDFYYTSEKRMEEAIDYWFFEYNKKGFVRWSIVDKRKHNVIGTIELFHRNSKDYFTDCGLLRLDIRSDYESADEIEQILSLIVIPAFDLFHCTKVATKAISDAAARICALKKLGFSPSGEVLTGYNNTVYQSYFVLTV